MQPNTLAMQLPSSVQVPDELVCIEFPGVSPAAVKVISNSDYDENHKSKFKTFQDEVDMLKLFQGNDCIVQIYKHCLIEARIRMRFGVLDCKLSISNDL